jgi:hypothetical protein
VTAFEKASFRLQNSCTSSTELFGIMEDLMTNLTEINQEFFLANVINCCSHVNDEKYKDVTADFLEFYPNAKKKNI